MYAPLSQRTPSDSTAETYVGGGERVDGEGKRDEKKRLLAQERPNAHECVQGLGAATQGLELARRASCHGGC